MFIDRSLALLLTRTMVRHGVGRLVAGGLFTKDHMSEDSSYLCCARDASVTIEKSDAAAIVPILCYV